MHNVHDFPGLRQAPANLEAERALLGTLLMRNGSYDKVCDYLKAEHFLDASHSRLYEIVSGMLSKGLQANPVTLRSYAESDQTLIAAGGTSFIAAVCASMPTVINIEEYGKIVRDLSIRRDLITISTQASHMAYDASESADSQVEGLEHKLFELSATRATNTFIHVSVAAQEAITQAERAFKADGALTGVTTGLADLDRQLGGLHASDLIILAGRPSMGKSGAALTIAFNAAEAGKAVAFFSFEMSSAQLANRALGHVTKLDSHKIRNGRIAANDFDALLKAKAEYESLPLMINDGAGLTVAQIRTACRRMKRKKLDLVVIDYLQLIQPGSKGGNRVEEVSAITWGLKALAKELNVPVLALSQLSRKVEEREDKRPQLSDLRESGSIEQDADVVMFVYREEYYLEREKKDVPQHLVNASEIIVSKQRHGPIGGNTFHFDHKSAWFSDRARGFDNSTR